MWVHLPNCEAGLRDHWQIAVLLSRKHVWPDKLTQMPQIASCQRLMISVKANRNRAIHEEFYRATSNPEGDPNVCAHNSRDAPM